MDRRALMAVVLVASLAGVSSGGDWPQWRGAGRDGKAADFDAPSTWPKQLTEKWKVTVGEGVATPALVDDRLYVFTRESGSEVTRCLNAATGDQVWEDKYETGGASGGAAGFSGPRSSPAVADGKVVTLGVRGKLSCLDAKSGNVLWRKDDFKGSVPQFYASSSPLIVEGLCIAQLGGGNSGGIVAYDLESGDQHWKWTGNGPGYASPVLMDIDGAQAVIAPTNDRLVALNVDDGTLLWNVAYSQGRYNAATPLVDEQLLIYAGPGRGLTAEKLERKDEKLTAREAWRSEENSLQFNTPVLRSGLIFGLSNLNSLFCLDAATGKALWSAPVAGQPAEGATAEAPRTEAPRTESAPADAPNTEPPAQPQRPRPGFGGRGFGQGGFGQGGRGRRGGGGGGYGSVVDAGAVLLALTPAGQLVVFEPAQEYKELARYKVATGDTYAYPIPSSQGIFIKDKTALTLWSAQ